MATKSSLNCEFCVVLSLYKGLSVDNYLSKVYEYGPWIYNTWMIDNIHRSIGLWNVVYLE